MRTIVARLVLGLLVVSTWLAASLPGVAATGVRVALVIGNGGYANVPHLPNSVRDAATMARHLDQLGFASVQLEQDLTRESLVKALRKFEAAAQNADWAMVYYAGHGLEVGGINYLVPVDAVLQTDKDVQDEAVSLDRVMSSIEGARQLRST